jgi:uncharacterized damage-inducible protein DinB
MQSKDLLKMNLEMATGMVQSLIEDMKDAPLTFPTPKGGSHPLWVLGHLAYSEGSILHEMMLGESNPLAEWKEIFADGTEPVSDADKYPPFDEVLAKCQEIHQASMALLGSLSEDDLDTSSKRCPPKYEGYFGTYRQCFQMVANHWLMHRGQVADARRAAGRRPLMG